MHALTWASRQPPEVGVVVSFWREGHCAVGKLSNLPMITQLANEDLKPSLSESRAWYFVASLVFAPTLASWLISSFSFLSVSLPESLSLFSLPHRLPPTTYVYLGIAFSTFFKGPCFRKVSLPHRFASPRFKGQAGGWYPGHPAAAWGHCAATDHVTDSRAPPELGLSVHMVTWIWKEQLLILGAVLRNSCPVDFVGWSV